jgi:hypothetical protein
VRFAHRLVSEYLSQRRKGAKVGEEEANLFVDCYSFFPNLASLRLGERNVRIRGSSTSEKFARVAQIFNYSSYEGHEGSRVFPTLRDLRGESSVSRFAPFASPIVLSLTKDAANSPIRDYCSRAKKTLSSNFLHRLMSAMSSGLRSAALGLIPCCVINLNTAAMTTISAPRCTAGMIAGSPA